MEVPGGHQNKSWVLISEFLGTAMLAAAVNWGGTSSGTPHCAGLTVFIMAQVFGPISGGHFNPAVSVMMYYDGALDSSDLLPYIDSEIAGGIVALQIYDMTNSSLY